MDNRFCPKCGKELDANAQFCIYCGTKQQAQEPPANVPPVSTANAPQPGPPNTQGAYPPVQTRQNSAGKPPRKRWPLFAGLGAAVVVIAVAVLFLTGVINLGGAPAFAAGDLNGNWTGELTLEAVNGTGSEADNLRDQIGDTQSMYMELTLDQSGKGTALLSYSSSVTAQLQGSSITIKGDVSSDAALDFTGNVTKNENGYSMKGGYSLTQPSTGVTIRGTMTMQLSAARATSEPEATPTPLATLSQTSRLEDETAAVSTPAPADAVTETRSLEGTWQYMYDEYNSYATSMEYHADGTCAVFSTEEPEPVTGTYSLNGDELILTMYPDGVETKYYYYFEMGTGRYTIMDMYTGESHTYVQVE